jgi:hypothetical protein
VSAAVQLTHVVTVSAAPHVEQKLPDAAALQEGQTRLAEEVDAEEDMREN